VCDARERELHDRIEAAFASRNYPGDEYIDSFDPRSPDDEEVIVFRGKNWREIVAGGASWYQAGNSALAVVKPVGLAYFLPAFLIISLEVAFEKEKVSGELYAFADSMCFFLAAP